MLEYHIKAERNKSGNAFANVNNGIIEFDATTGRQDSLANPAELLLTSLAACMLKNVERFSTILKFEYKEAKVSIDGVRNDKPPYMSEIFYKLEIESNMEERTLELLHKNILKYGTITNTLAKAAKLNGTIELAKF